MKFRIIGSSIGWLIGAFLRTGTGIVGGFGGVSGLVVFAILGGIASFSAVPDTKRIIQFFRSMN